MKHQKGTVSQGSLNVLREGVLTRKINVGVISSSMAFKAMEMDEITQAENVERENKTKKDLDVLSESSKNELIMFSLATQC